MELKDYYSYLGKLLYAIADIDHVISVKEKNKFLEIVKDKLFPAEVQQDEYGTNLAFYTEFEFDFLDEEIIDSSSAFQSFIDFIEIHQTAIDEHTKKVTLQIAEELAAAYYYTNFKEKVLLDKLKSTLQKIKN